MGCAIHVLTMCLIGVCYTRTYDVFDRGVLYIYVLKMCLIGCAIYVVILCSFGVCYIRSYDVFDRGVLQVRKHGTTS